MIDGQSQISKANGSRHFLYYMSDGFGHFNRNIVLECNITHDTEPANLSIKH